MSVDLIVLFDWCVPEATPDWLLQRLAANPVELQPVVDRYRSRWRVQAWECAGTEGAGRLELRGPGGFAIRFEPHRVEIYHLVPFSYFASDAEARDQLRRAWRWFAQQFGSRRAIYTHELMPYPGASLFEVESALRSKIGPPARDFQELAAAEEFGPRAWYIDDFASQHEPGSAVERRTGA